MMNFTTFQQYMDRICEEARRDGLLDAMLVPYGTEYFGELYAKGAVDNNPRCLACDDRPNQFAALIAFEATTNPTATLPVPICHSCWLRYSDNELQDLARQLIVAIGWGDTPIRFCTVPR
jgi:hypothetical protein